MGISLTINTIQRGDLVSSIEYGDISHPNLPTKIIYKIHNASRSFTETVDLTYTSSGDPIFKGVEYRSHKVDIGEGILELVEASSSISVSSQMEDSLNTSDTICELRGIKEELKKINVYFALITDQKL